MGNLRSGHSVHRWPGLQALEPVLAQISLTDTVLIERPLEKNRLRVHVQSAFWNPVELNKKSVTF